jgi:hypothetical protein
MRARADPSIATYRYRRDRTWAGPLPETGPCGHEYAPAGESIVSCHCGNDHRIYRCSNRAPRSELIGLLTWIMGPILPRCTPAPTRQLYTTC